MFSVKKERLTDTDQAFLKIATNIMQYPKLRLWWEWSTWEPFHEPINQGMRKLRPKIFFVSFNHKPPYHCEYKSNKLNHLLIATLNNVKKG